jgi:hypothetical protein
MALVAVLGAPAAHGAVLCTKKSGVLAVRDASCRKKETQVALADFGAVGPAGPTGPQGPAGPAGPGGPIGPSDILFSEQGIVDIGTSDTTIDTLTVGPGSWMVFASVAIQITSLESASGRCTLEYPGDTVGNSFDYETVHAGHSLQLPVFANTSTTITLACDKGASGSSRTLNSQITAIRTATLSSP